MNRVHCTLLFEEELRQKALWRNGSNNEETVLTIMTLFKVSGCKNQICETCDISEVDLDDFTSTNYKCMQAMAKIR